MNKVDVNGPGTHAVFEFLKDATPDSSDVKWNFASYWLVSRTGSVERLEGGRKFTAPPYAEERIAVALNS